MKYLIFLAPISLIFAVIFFATIQPSLRSKERLQAEQDQLLSQIGEASLKISELETSQGNSASNPVLFWVETSPSLAMSNLQSYVTDAAERQNLVFHTISALPVGDVGGFHRLGFRLETRGKLTEIVSFLQELERSQPPVGVSRMTLRHNPFEAQSGPGTLIDANLDVNIFAHIEEQK